jgi:ketosteroid isomerase-like protein
MTENEALIEQFYSAFQQKDGARMASFYADDASFRDEVFNLKGKQEVGAMWMMLCAGAKDFSLEFSDIQEVEEGMIKADWQAIYRFSKTGRMVHNRIHAVIKMQNGLIKEHIDHFDFWKWSSMALGLPGFILGWTPLLKKKVQAEAASRLSEYLKDNRL